MVALLRAGLVRLLQVPLTVKLAGAQLLVVTLGACLVAASGWRPTDAWEVAHLAIAATIGIPVTIALVVLALRPLHQLEHIAQRIGDGDYTARVPDMLLADPAMKRLSITFNGVLDQLTEDRSRMRALASEAIRTGDEERSRAALRLHESAAQSIASVSWQLGALARDVSDEDLQHRLLFVKRLTEDVLEDVRQLAETMHPRVLTDLGLAAALSQLARQTEAKYGVRVSAHLDRAVARHVDPATAAALYRTAQEAVFNAVHHGQPGTVRIWLFADGPTVRLEVIDDGQGFDVKDAERKQRHGGGIFAMRDRLALVNARLTVESNPGAGTRVCAHIANSSAGTEKSA